ncbi:MAG: lysine--tRNA ligase [Myxococcales bacterium]|nr:lysine--tRNA ligase [Myxococcales bacterium]
MTEKPVAEASAAGESGEEGLIQARREKASRVRARGQNPFANDLDVTDRASTGSLRQRFAPALLEPAHELRYDPEKVAKLAGDDLFHLVGRLMARRGFGKATFMRLRDGAGELQLFAKQDVMGAAFAALEDVDVADHIEVRGRPMVTKTGELTVELCSLRLLTKALRPLPDKWHGLSDVDLRYRRRYVDTVANPEAALALVARSAIVQGLRAFLDAEGFMEVETPTLHSVIGGAAARPFTTHHNTLDLDLYLRIAPELYLKRLLVGGFERVYEIGRCYRNEGISTRHNPEFTMLEFYMSYATYGTLMDLTEELLRSVDEALERRLEVAGHAARYQEWRAARSFTFDEPFARAPMKQAVASALERADIPFELFERMAEIALPKDAPPGPASPGAALVGEWAKKSARAKKIDWSNFRKGLGVCENDGERLFCAYEYLAEPFLAEDYRSRDGSKSVPVFVIDYPAEVSPLARRKDADPTLVDRFELFVDGRELCNAFSELNDPEDQAARFVEQVEKKTRGAEETMDYDADYVRALEHGMPPAAGFGLGVDRLVMMLACQPSIRDVIAFPLLRPEAV